MTFERTTTVEGKSIGRNNNDTSMAFLILAINQLLGRKSVIKIGEWVSETPIPRWTKIEPNKLTKDYFLSALDNISAQNENMKSSYSYPIQNNIRLFAVSCGKMGLRYPFKVISK